VFWWLWAGALLSALATFVGPFLALFLTARGLRLAQVGLVASCLGVGALLSGPLAGSLADTIGRRRTLVGAVLLFGAASTATRPPMRATVADVVAGPAVPRAFGWIYWGENVGASVSLLLGGLLATGGWSLPFLCDGATTLAYAAVVLLRIPETRPVAPASSSPGSCRLAEPSPHMRPKISRKIACSWIISPNFAISASARSARILGSAA
jgi:MFS family permease